MGLGMIGQNGAHVTKSATEAYDIGVARVTRMHGRIYQVLVRERAQSLRNATLSRVLKESCLDGVSGVLAVRHVIKAGRSVSVTASIRTRATKMVAARSH